MNTQNDLILISMHSLKAFTSVLREHFYAVSIENNMDMHMAFIIMYSKIVLILVIQQFFADFITD